MDQKNKKNNNSQDTEQQSTEDVNINYNDMLVQNIYNSSEPSYYVFASFDDDEKVSTYQDSISKYSETDGALKIYNIDFAPIKRKLNPKENI